MAIFIYAVGAGVLWAVATAELLELLRSGKMLGPIVVGLVLALAWPLFLAASIARWSLGQWIVLEKWNPKE